MKRIGHFLKNHLIKWTTNLLLFSLLVSFFAALITFIDTVNILVNPKEIGLLFTIFSGLNLVQNDHKEILYLLLNFLVLFVTIISLILSSISYYKLKIKIQSRSSIKTIELKQKDEDDDMKIMAKYYKNSDFVYVFSGDFSWLNNDSIKSVINNLINSEKIFLFSTKSQKVVQHTIGNDFCNNLVNSNQMFFINVDDPLRFSLIVKDGTRTLLFKNTNTSDPENNEFISALVDTNESRYALYFINQLIKQIPQHQKQNLILSRI